jgi:hypothetical protein
VKRPVASRTLLREGYEAMARVVAIDEPDFVLAFPSGGTARLNLKDLLAATPVLDSVAVGDEFPFTAGPDNSLKIHFGKRRRP